MTDGDVTELRYWLDLLIKGAIGIVISLVGMDYRQVKNSLKELEQSKYQLTMHVEVMQSEMGTIKDRLQRIEQKIDRILEK
jgi:predicted nuclease with TOPRIM domain